MSYKWISTRSKVWIYVIILFSGKLLLSTTWTVSSRLFCNKWKIQWYLVGHINLISCQATLIINNLYESANPIFHSCYLVESANLYTTVTWWDIPGEPGRETHTKYWRLTHNCWWNSCIFDTFLLINMFPAARRKLLSQSMTSHKKIIVV